MTVHELFVYSRLIVRATPLRYQRAPAERSSFGMIEFGVVEVLKGEEPSKALVLVGMLEDKDDFNDHPVPYSFVRPGGRHGNCSALNYRPGAEYLLFLGRNGERWHTVGALAPSNEQLRSPGDPWLLWARNYLAAIRRGQDQTAAMRAVRWEAEVRPLIESLLTVRVSRRMGTGGKPFSAEIENPRASEDPFIADPLLEEIAASLVARGAFLRSESAGRYLTLEQERGKLPERDLREVERRYRLLFLDDPDALRRIMPVVHQVLGHNRAECLDCPGPTRLVATVISREEILASVARNALQPYLLKLCVLSSGLTDREFGAEEAALRIGRDSDRTKERVDQVLDHQVRCLVFQKDQDEAARAEARRRDFVRQLDQDKEFWDATRPILRDLAQIGIVCADCE